ncbi:MAG: HEPN domain-containing protein [Oscillospiraceae bacterium]|nr:HEPN domain-containing protein [Oscillospiraceae bacterium]
MVDKAGYWLGLCGEDLVTAGWLLEGGRLLHMAYFCHQVAEKALKAVVASVEDEAPPKIHDLKKLAVKGGVYEALPEELLAFIDELEPFQIEARYPDYKIQIEKTLTLQKCKRILKETEAFLCWIKRRLGQ